MAQEVIEKPDKLTLRNISIIWKNFVGKETMYNQKGKRNFHIRIDDPDLFAIMLDGGWNVKPLKKREPDEPDAWHMQVHVNFDNDYPPRVYKMTLDKDDRVIGKVKLEAETVMLLDILRVQFADVTISPFVWTHSGRTGVSAYLDVMYAVTEENPLDLEWDEREAQSVFDTGPEEDDIDEAMM